MSSSKLYVKDLNSRFRASELNTKKNLYTYLINDSLLPFGLKRYACTSVSFYGKNTSIIRVRNRCVYTYRSRSINTQFKVSRLVLRDLLWKLLLPGMRVASW